MMKRELLLVDLDFFNWPTVVEKNEEEKEKVEVEEEETQERDAEKRQKSDAEKRELRGVNK